MGPTIIPEITEEFWKNACWYKPIQKRLLSFRIDSDVLEWFKENHEPYQTKINSVLRYYMRAHTPKASQPIEAEIPLALVDKDFV